MREWLTIIVVVLILGILLDGWRRMRNARRDTLKVSRSVYRPKPSDKAPAPTGSESSPFSSELPNGGARVIGSRGAAAETVRKDHEVRTKKPGASTSIAGKNRQNSEPQPDPLDPEWSDPGAERELQPDPIWSAAPEPGPSDNAAYDNEDQHVAEQETAERDAEPEQVPVRRATPEEETARIPQQVTLNLDESVPLLMESVEDDEQENEATPAAVATKRAQRSKESAREPSVAQDLDVDSEIGDFDGRDERIEPTLGSVAELDTAAAEAPKAKSKNSKAAPKAEPAPSPSEEDPGEPEEVLIINVMARPGHYFQGEPLLHEIFDAGMRYGSMSIFHRYRDARGGGPVLFSLANMVKPGTFDLDAMEQFQTPGVSLFMTLPLSGDSLEAFDLMLDTAKRIAENLNGELKDENRSVMTKQTMEHDRQRVLEFERRQLSRAH